LGLAIAAGIVKAHGGKVWAESPGYDEQELPGSTFFIRLPMPKEK
jgi:signal transduction histidine kinase